MRLSRVVLSRGNQKAILQGMIHIAPSKLYEMLQNDIDWAAKNDYQIFFEGPKRDSLYKPLTKNEREIETFFLLLFDLYPVFAEALGVSVQKEKILYPQDAVNADIPFAEFTRELDKNGFHCAYLIRLFTLAPKEQLKERLKREFAKRGGLNAWMNSADRLSFRTFVSWFMFRKAMPIILDYRNKAAVEKIRTHSNGKNIFVHYGEKHIRGLIDLLKKDGYAIEETSFIDLAKFC